MIATAELAGPQSVRVAMCPPQASTGVADAAVKVIVMLVELSLLYAPERLYGTAGFNNVGSLIVTLVIVPLNIVKTWFQRPSAGLGLVGSRLRPVCVSGGIEKVVGGPHPATPEQGSFPDTSVRLYEVT